MDNGEACFILSSRNEVDRTAAVSEAEALPRREGHRGAGERGSAREETCPRLLVPPSNPQRPARLH